MSYRAASATLIALIVAACAGSPSIRPAAASKSEFEGAVYSGEETTISSDKSGGEEYRVFRQGATGFVSLQTVREDAEQRMSEFCDRKSKVGQPLRERTSVPPHVLGNFPRVEIVFSCVSKPAPTQAATPVSDSKYIRLTNLKKLLDERVITQQEFEAEKAKILAGP